MSIEPAAPRNFNWMVWSGRVLSALPVLMLLMSAWFKFNPMPEFDKELARMGYEKSLMPSLGVVEVVCTLLYAIPQTAVLGAVLLTGYLGGATATHVRISDPFHMPIILGVMIWLGLFLRDARVRALLPWRRI